MLKRERAHALLQNYCIRLNINTHWIQYRQVRIYLLMNALLTVWY